MKQKIKDILSRLENEAKLIQDEEESFVVHFNLSEDKILEINDLLMKYNTTLDVLFDDFLNAYLNEMKVEEKAHLTLSYKESLSLARKLEKEEENRFKEGYFPVPIVFDYDEFEMIHQLIKNEGLSLDNFFNKCYEIFKNTDRAKEISDQLSEEIIDELKDELKKRKKN